MTFVLYIPGYVYLPSCNYNTDTTKKNFSDMPLVIYMHMLPIKVF